MENNVNADQLIWMYSDFIWDFGKLPFPEHLRIFIIKSWKINAKIYEIVK